MCVHQSQNGLSYLRSKKYSDRPRMSNRVSMFNQVLSCKCTFKLLCGFFIQTIQIFIVESSHFRVGSRHPAGFQYHFRSEAVIWILSIRISSLPAKLWSIHCANSLFLSLAYENLANTYNPKFFGCIEKFCRCGKLRPFSDSAAFENDAIVYIEWA